MNDKIASVTNEIKQKEKNSKIYTENDTKEEINNKKMQSELIFKQFQKDFHTEEIAKKSAENSINQIKKILEEKRLQIEMIKNPNSFKTELPKNFLASEKLAFTKKRKSLSPAKIRTEIKPTRSGSKRIRTAKKIL